MFANIFLVSIKTPRITFFYCNGNVKQKHKWNKILLSLLNKRQCFCFVTWCCWRSIFFYFTLQGEETSFSFKREDSIYAFWDENLNYLGNEQPQHTTTSKERETIVKGKETFSLIKHVTMWSQKDFITNTDERHYLNAKNENIRFKNTL